MAEAIAPEIVPEYAAVREEEAFDLARVQAYLVGKLEGAYAPLSVQQFRGGHSNLTYLLRFGDREWVLRRPPFPPIPPGAHDMAREYRVLSRLWRVFQPAPRAMLFCDDAAIVGAPFFIMERRRGIVIRMRQPLPLELPTDVKTLQRVSESFIDTLGDLHTVDFEAIGLVNLGNPSGFVRRQIVGWMDRWERSKTREVPLMNKLGAWLLDNMPAPQPPALLHNDFFLHNVMLGADDPGRVVGVFDWEMSTLGDPMIDLGTAIAYWRENSDPSELLAETGQGHVPTLTPGFLSRAQLIQRYAKRTGRDVSKVAFYWAWAHWKTATVVEQLYARYVKGGTTDPRFATMGGQAPALASAAAIVATQLGFKS
ncbi:MAG TPA: phosphotransferase family protein [Candidatus Binataceae bacterium]